jgi:hypothetical protein
MSRNSGWGSSHTRTSTIMLLRMVRETVHAKKKRADLFSLLVDSVVQINLASPI